MNLLNGYILTAIAISLAALALQYLVAKYQNKDNDPDIDEFAATAEHPTMKANNDA